MGKHAHTSMPPTARILPGVPRAFGPNHNTCTRTCYLNEGMNPARRFAFSKDAGGSSLVIQSPL